MHQETTEGKRSTLVMDLILLVVLILAIFFINGVINALRAYVGASILQGILFIAIVGLCLYMYSRRLCSYSYTFYYEDPDPQDEIEGVPNEPRPETGTFLAAQIVSAKSKVAEAVHVREMTDLLPPGEMDLNRRMPHMRMTDKRYKDAYALLYERDEQAHCLYFSPSDALVSLLREALDAKRAA